MIYAFLDQHQDSWPVRVMARVLEVSASGYYAWKDRPPSEQQQRRDRLLVQILAVQEQVKHRYGSPRIHAELEAQGHGCCVNSVAKIMRQAGLRARTARKFKQTTDSNHCRPVAENVLDRQFTATRPNESWVADLTYIPTREGWLYLAVVEDLYSRKVVGWSMDATMTSRLVVDALEMAVKARLPGEGLVAHSDRGSQYASEHYQRLLSRHGIACSMSGVGQCWDNAPVESFFASLKTDTTIPSSLHSRCRGRYNRPHRRLPVGAARVGQLVPRPATNNRRIRTMSRPRPDSAPPRA